MSEYIDREALLAEMRVSSKAAYLVVMDAPAANVAPVVRGRWVRHTVDGTDMFGEPTKIVFACNCSVCGLDGRSETPYCPNCGARMGGE